MGRHKKEEIEIVKINKDKKPDKTVAEIAREHSQIMSKAHSSQDSTIRIHHADGIVKNKYMREMEFKTKNGNLFAKKNYCVGVGKIEGKQERIIANRGI